VSITFDNLKTAAEQAAFELGEKLQETLGENTLSSIGRLYAHTHQFVLLPHSEFGFRRLNAAFRAGAKLPQLRKDSAALAKPLTISQEIAVDLLKRGYTVLHDRSGESDISCAAFHEGSFRRVNAGTMKALEKRGIVEAVTVSPFCTRYDLIKEDAS
jgi:hypothetical protein